MTPYQLLDCGGARRLERFGSCLVDRPAPAAAFPRTLPEREWQRAGLSFSPEAGWRGAPPQPWPVAFGSAVLSLRPSANGGLGVFPEHAQVCDHLAALLAPDSSSTVLNLFAHTGLATLRLAALPQVAETVHVDASAGAVAQARENAVLSGLAGAPVRWLVDDALTFLRREKRRGRRYTHILADPPSYGRSKKKDWRLERDLPELSALAADLLSPGGLFVLTCHSEGWTGDDLAARLDRRFGGVDAQSLTLTPESGGRALPAGWAVFATLEG